MITSQTSGCARRIPGRIQRFGASIRPSPGRRSRAGNRSGNRPRRPARPSTARDRDNDARCLRRANDCRLLSIGAFGRACMKLAFVRHELAGDRVRDVARVDKAAQMGRDRDGIAGGNGFYGLDPLRLDQFGPREVVRDLSTRSFIVSVLKRCPHDAVDPPRACCKHDKTVEPERDPACRRHLSERGEKPSSIG